MTKRLLPITGHRFYLCIMIIFFALSSCKKDKQSVYADLLQHKWTLKSVSQRLTVYNANVGQWNTTRSSPVKEYREFTNAGILIYSSITGSPIEQKYTIQSDSVILYLGIYYPAVAPDTSFIRKINDNLFLNYRRIYFISPNYSTVNEYIDSLYR
jgi:hypothetical protein